MLHKTRNTLLRLPEARTHRLILREINPGIARAVLGLSTDEAFRILGCRTKADWTFFKQRYRHFETHNQRLSYRNWLLADASTGKLIGDCGFHTWWLHNRQAELGYGMWDIAYRRKGLMAEAMEEVIRIGFQEMELERVEAFVGPDNSASISLLQKFGFRARARLTGPADVVDTLAFTLHSQDYQAALSPPRG
ncbi:MAG: GNAT family N-acetyltransferase [Phaeodactylibacter sp.]|nr:GNAT family N-acetyltransferase [Phaeodactylibacter sp.]MCB9276798.1 GNAT family N-acetyltransferase [Lewinellaceae bacterium]